MLLLFLIICTLACVSCAASTYCPIQDLKAREEHLIKKDIWVLPSPIPFRFLEHCEGARGASSLALICAAPVLCCCLSKNSKNMGTTPALLPSYICAKHRAPRPTLAQDETRPDQTWYIHYIVWVFYYILLLQSKRVGHRGEYMHGVQRAKERAPSLPCRQGHGSWERPVTRSSRLSPSVIHHSDKKGLCVIGSEIFWKNLWFMKNRLRVYGIIDRFKTELQI